LPAQYPPLSKAQLFCACRSFVHCLPLANSLVTTSWKGWIMGFPVCQPVLFSSEWHRFRHMPRGSPWAPNSRGGSCGVLDMSNCGVGGPHSPIIVRGSFSRTSIVGPLTWSTEPTQVSGPGPRTWTWTWSMDPA
jgi:hypothetical protein